MKPTSRLLYRLILLMPAWPTGGYPASAQNAAKMLSMPGVTVTGRGEVKIRPDKLDVIVGVSTGQKSSQAVVADNAAALQRLQNAVRKAGVVEKDIQTESSSVAPTYTRDTDPETPGLLSAPRILNYSMYSHVRVTVRNPARVGDILDAIKSAGSSEIESVQITEEAQKAAQNEALEKAVQDARRKADLLVKAAGVRLNGVIAITDDTGGHHPIFRTASDLAVPFAPNELVITAKVTITYGLTGILSK